MASCRYPGGLVELSLREILHSYNDQAPLDQSHTIPATWYVDERIAQLERQHVFGGTWQVVARIDQLLRPGQFVTTQFAGEPLVVVRSADGQLRAFYNVCRHHAAAVVTEASGEATIFRCPYHGWSYGLDGTLKGAPEFEGVCGFDRAKNGLVSVQCAVWEQFVFVNLDRSAAPLPDFLGGLVARVAPLNLDSVHFFERRVYSLGCNWKVFVDNYLDGGYHVPHLHKGLNSVLEYKQYTIETEDRYCLQSSPMVASERGCGDVGNATRRAGVVFLAVSQLHDQSVQGIYGHESRFARWCRSLHRDFRFLFRRCERGSGRKEPAEHRRRRTGERRRRGDLRERAAGLAFTGLWGGTVIGTT